MRTKAKPIKKILKMIAIVAIIFSGNVLAQVRPNINNLDVDPVLTTAQEQDELACLIKNYLDANPDFIMMHMMRTDIHINTANFFTWHRFYIGILEEYLTSVGMDKYVPLPKWDPNTTIPNAFYNGPCAAASGYTPPANQNITPSSYFSTFSTIKCNYTTLDNLANDVENAHNGVHGLVGGSMCCLSSAPGTPIFLIWHAYVDDLWKEWECGCDNPPNFPQISNADLYMKDINNDTKTILNDGLDIGYEPFPVTESLSTLPIYDSHDLWVRNGITGNDGITVQVHQNPDYSSLGMNNYVYVRVRNRGCQVSSGTEQLKVYWARADAGLSWPTDFNNHLVSGILNGDIIGTQTIAPLKPGEIKIYVFPWLPPKPEDFGDDPTTGTHTCMLARIETSSTSPFGMAFPETNDIAYNTVQNNNIIWKNMNVVNTPANGKVRFLVGNPCPETATLNLAFTVPVEEKRNMTLTDGTFDDPMTMTVTDLGKNEAFTEYGMITVDLGKDLYDKWVRGGKKGSGFEEGKYSHMSANGILHHHSLQHFPNAASPYAIVVTGDNAKLENLNFTPAEKTNIQVNFNYHAQPVGDTKQEFKYLVNQESPTPTNTCSGIGGVGFTITRPVCEIPNAGPDVTIGKGCTTTLTASPIIAGATYVWYDNNTGDFIGTGSSITVSPKNTSSYELQMASPNGCVDYDTVTVNISTNIFLACVTPPGCFDQVQIFPNRVGDNNLHVRFVAQERTDITISVSELTSGRPYINQNVRVDDPGPIDRILPLDRVPPGVYKVIIKCKDKVHTETITRM